MSTSGWIVAWASVSPCSNRIHLTKALALSEQLIRQYPNRPQYIATQAEICQKFVEVYEALNRPDDTEQSARQAVQLQLRLVDTFPEVETYLVHLAKYKYMLARWLVRRGKLIEAQSIAQSNIDRTSRLLKEHPEMWYLHAILRDANHILADALLRNGENYLADIIRLQAREHGKKLQEVMQQQPSDNKTNP